MERGTIRVRDSDGGYPYERFEVETSADVFLHLTKLLDGAEVNLDVSSATLEVHLRGKVKGATSSPIDVTMTKRTGTTTNGDTGKVSGVVRPSATDFAAGSFCAMGVYLVDMAVTDAATVSGKKETLWLGLWDWTVVGKFTAATV